MIQRRRVSRICTVFAGAGFAMLAQGTGWAQTMGRLFPVAVPGYAEAPGVTARSRLHPEYDPAGVAAAGSDFVVYPVLAAGFGFDSAPVSGAGSSAFAAIRPSLRIQDDALGLAGFASADLTRYARGEAADSNDVTAALGFGIPLGPDRMTVGVARAVTAESGLGLAQSGGTAPFRVVMNDGRIAMRLPFGGFDATERLGVSHEVLATAGGIAPAFRGRTVLRESSEIATAPDRVLRWLVLLKAAQARYRGVVPDAGFGNSGAIAALGGFETDAASLWRLRVLAGVMRQGFAGDVAPARITPVFSAGLGWTPDGLISFDLAVSRVAGLESALGTPGTAVTSADLVIAEAYRRNLLLTATIDARAARIGGAAAREIDIDAGATWHVSRAFALKPRLWFALRQNLPGSPPREARATISMVWSP
ncbi:outer membrane beta-barrel protein [Acidiphilium sp. AL]|uniref:outer membrane beta-barrel protein n=1 Tax=Acidiphilium sp. AL TaxID=2871704 RepID=UPI0021CB85DB|nr:outer membrane beta-barrel protein [Acidiphilium sp. AL]MCU4161340.1 outer membrane beta-barrel protein [Acidiphilium sp. AL]